MTKRFSFCSVIFDTRLRKMLFEIMRNAPSTKLDNYEKGILPHWKATSHFLTHDTMRLRKKRNYNIL